MFLYGKLREKLVCKTRDHAYKSPFQTEPVTIFEEKMFWSSICRVDPVLRNLNVLLHNTESFCEKP